MSAIGVVLAGGLGSRMGGDKATVELDGVALLRYPLRALAAVTARQAVVAKAGSVLPQLAPEVAHWIEPDEPRHPLTGVIHALRSAGGEAVLCCAVDLPRLDAATLRALLDTPVATQRCVVAEADGRLQPLCALWRPEALPTLERLPAGMAMRDVVTALDAVVVPIADARIFANVNVPEELLRIGSARRGDRAPTRT